MATPKTTKDDETKKPVSNQAAPNTNRTGANDAQAPRNQGNAANPAGRSPANDGARSNIPPVGQQRRPEGARSDAGRPQQPAYDPNARRAEGTRPQGSSGPANSPAGRRPDAARPGVSNGEGGSQARRPDAQHSPSGQSTNTGRPDPQRGPSGQSTNAGRPDAQRGPSAQTTNAGRSGPGAGQRQGGGSPGGRPGGGAGDRRGPSSGGPRPQGSNGGNRHGPQQHGGPHRGRSNPSSSAAPAAAPRTTTAPAAPVVTEVVIPPLITVRELAEKMHKSPIEVIKALMNYGIMVPITQTIDFDTAAVVGDDLGIAVKPEVAPEPEVQEEPAEAPRTLRQQIMAQEDPEALVLRPPVVTVLGHVDHGKTTLLDAIRETRVVEGEAGGITQHIGAYQVERAGRKITFLDTPGHEAFTAMRARGASVTDIAVLVVAADDGVMPQTKEAIAHAKAAQVPIVVALNKIDKANSNPDRVKQELAENGVLVEEYGGDVVCVPVSAKLRRGIDDILESILLVYDVDPAKANPGGACVGSVIESQLDKNRGPMATLLVQNGTLHTGDSIVMGDTYGKIRAMFDDKGQAITEAPPSTPVIVLGLDEVPQAGNTFKVVADERTARSIAAERQALRKAEANQPAAKAMTLENIFAQVEAGQAKDLNLILKADVQGSLEPIVNSLDKLSNDKVRVKILHEGTGNITESDVMLAVASKAIILGFSVSVDGTAQRTAEAEGVDIRVYNIIYNLVEDVEKALAGMLEPVFQEVVTGHAEVRQVFRVTKVGKIGGCMVLDGEATRGSAVRVKRGGEVLREDKLTTLKRFQEDVAEVKAGYECGINLANFNDFEVGDVIEMYKKERVS